MANLFQSNLVVFGDRAGLGVYEVGHFLQHRQYLQVLATQGIFSVPDWNIISMGGGPEQEGDRFLGTNAYDWYTWLNVHETIHELLRQGEAFPGISRKSRYGLRAMAGDPAIAAIEKHRQALQAWLAPPSETHEDDKISNRLMSVERDAWRKWLTTQPTTLAGVIATLQHASRYSYVSDKPCDPCDRIYANLMEAGEYLDDTRDIGEQFPQMIAEALQKITGS